MNALEPEEPEIVETDWEFILNDPEEDEYEPDLITRDVRMVW
jgi:hypothetical protein